MSQAGTAVVTGAGQGIGRAIAERLVADGYDVLALDVNAEQLAGVAAAVGCRTAVVDVTDDAAVASVVGQAPDCRVLVNNAAIQRYHDLLHTTHEEMRTVLDVNVIGPVLMAQALVPVMAANGGGVVVNLSSITSSRARGVDVVVSGVEGGRQSAHGGDGRRVRAPWACASTPSVPAPS